MIRAAFVLTVALGLGAHARAEPLELSDVVRENVREIRARNLDLRDDAFSKMGGSSVASKAFLHCFATPYVDLGDHADLSPTTEYFNTGPRNSFNRQSEAAGVSWNLRYILSGRPANFHRELEATRARWALVLFGGNDAQNENERVFVQRLVRLVEQIEERGVVPILGSALPRRNSSKDRWIRRFNDITAAVAKHWALPYIDYHTALSSLPRKGLAHDGVHPNVLGEGGVRAACQLTENGLRHGNNTRNLLTLQMLDALRRLVTEEAGAPSGTGGTEDPSGAGTPSAHDPFPISALVHKPDLPPGESLPTGCGTLQPGARLYRTRLELLERTRIRASALDLAGHKPRVLWVRLDEQGERCVRRRHQTLEVDAGPGMWDLIVEVPDRSSTDDRMLVLITRER
jgi:hypothetical protein